MHLRRFLVEGELKGFESSANVRRVAKWLLLRHAAAAPVIVLSTEDYIGHFVWTYLGLHREWLLTQVSLKTPLKVVTAELFDRDAFIGSQVRVQ